MNSSLDMMLSFAASYVAAMILHECGHLVAARACGVPAREMGFGVGRRLATFDLAGFRLTFGALPVASYLLIDGDELHRKTLPQQMLVHLNGIAFNLAAAILFSGTIFAKVNLLLALTNLLPIYQQDGWKCGVALLRHALRRRSEPFELLFSFSGGALSLYLLFALMRHLASVGGFFG